MTIDPTDAAAYAWPSIIYPTKASSVRLSPSLADQHTRYLAERQHTLSTAGVPDGPPRWRKQTIYVLKEALELSDAIIDTSISPADLKPVRHEIADVVLAVVTLANYLGVTVEDCIAEKTAADRGRG